MIANVLDMYHGDNNEAVPDFAALKAAGVIGIAHKISQGIIYKDPKYAARRVAAKAVGLKWFGYHFLTIGYSGAAQSQYAYDAAHPTTDETIALDYEDGGGATVSQLYMAMQDLDVRLGKPCMIYSGNRIRETLNSTMAMWGAMPAHPLWLAEYGPVEKLPAPWTRAALWQYSESGVVSGITGKIDTNFFDGNADALGNMLATGHW